MKYIIGTLASFFLSFSVAFAVVSLPSTIKKGDLMVGSTTTNSIYRLATGTRGSILWMNSNGLPSWTATSTLGISGGSGLTSLNGQTGSTQTFSTSSSGTVFDIQSSGDVHNFIFPATIPIAGGGTGQSSYTTNGVLFYDGTQFNTSANSFFWNGSSLSLSVGGGASHTALLDVNGSLRINGEFLLNASAGSSGDLIVSAGAGNPPQWQSKATADIAEASRTISTTAPLAGGGDLTADRTFSIAQSSDGVDGYLSGTDWRNFNDKVSSQWVTSGSNIYYNTGRVAINTTTFVSTLSLGASTTASGGINFGDASTNLYRTGNSSLKTDAAMYASAGFFSQYFIDATNAKGFWNTGVSGINWRNENRVTTNVNVQLLGIASQTADLLQVASSTGGIMLNIKSDGRLGIGTSSPTSQLHIQGTSTAPTVPLLTLSSSTGSTLFTVTPAGNVGIGTNNPTQRLDVKSPTNGSVAINIRSGDGARDVAQFGEDAWGAGNLIFKDSSQVQQVKIGAYGNSYINQGNVGIGTTTPGKKLVIQDSVTTNTAQLMVSDSSSTSAKAYFGSFSDNAYITSGGTYAGGWVADATNKSIAGINLSGATGGSFINFSTAATDNTAPSVRMTLDKNGNLGIGTATPILTLNVNGPMASIVPGNNAGAYLYSGSGYGILQAINARNTASINLAINPNGGNVGIGTAAPGAKLSIDSNTSGVTALDADSVAAAPITWRSNGTLIGSLSYSGNNAVVRANAGDLYFDDGVDVNMVVTTAGNVGIGTTSPTSLLHVAGTFTATGSTTLNSLTAGTVCSTASGQLYISSCGMQSAITAGSLLSFSGATLNVVGLATTTLNTFKFTSTSTNFFLNPEHIIYPFYIENPGTNEDVGLWIANATTTITKILCVNKGASDTAKVNLVWDNSRQTSTTTTSSKLFTDYVTCNSTTTPTSLSITGSSTVNTLQSLRFITSTASTSGMTLTIFGRDNQ